MRFLKIDIVEELIKNIDLSFRDSEPTDVFMNPTEWELFSCSDELFKISVPTSFNDTTLIYERFEVTVNIEMKVHYSVGDISYYDLIECDIVMHHCEGENEGKESDIELEWGNFHKYLTLK